MDNVIKILVFVVLYFAVQTSAQGSSNGYGRCIGCDDDTINRGCISCQANGVYQQPNNRFSYKSEDGCFMLNCFCYCNGTYDCPSEDSVYLCGNSRPNNNRDDTTRSPQRPRGDCQFCTPYNNGKRIEPNTYFTYTNGCSEYSDCYCQCDGYWRCPAQRVRNLCSSSGAGTQVKERRTSDGCRLCDAGGLIVEPNTYFTYRNGCNEWSNCQCKCDGGWSCPEYGSWRWVCDNICRQCDINGTKYRGNTEFVYRKDCFEYDPCHCHCNGTWNCPARNGRWVCTDQCRNCDVKGQIEQGNTIFKYREDCWEWDSCSCRCNGSWNCPKENAKWVCKERCLDCDINGTKYRGNSKFQLTKECLQFNCDCRCNGSWNCPAERTIDTCNMNPRTGCFYCNVNGERYEGNSIFSHKEGCINYTNCVCNCNGAWECPGASAVDTCRINSTTGCYYCDVRGRRFQGQSRFQLEEGCWSFECDCDCNGRWRCHDDGAVYTCGSQVSPGGCRECYVGGLRHQARQPFDLRWGCIDYKCQCNCDGSWICPADKALVICEGRSFQNFQIRTISSTPASWCSNCYINGSVYPGNSQFEYQVGCMKHYVRCYCNGGFRKTSNVASNCARGFLTGSISSSTSVTTCNRCLINGNTFGENTQFDLNVGCSSFSCQCSCSGLPRCQISESNLCRTVIRSIGEITGTGGSTLVVRGGSSSGNVVIGGGSGSSTRVVGGNSGGTIVVGGARTGGTESRTVRVDGGTVIGGSTVVVRGGGTSTSGGTIVTGSGGGTVSRGGTVIVTGNRGTSSSGGTIVTGGGSSTTRTGTVVVSGNRRGGIRLPGCGFCIVEGRRYRGGSTFQFSRDCLLYSCRCDCRSRAICIPTVMTNCRIGQGDRNCRQCTVNGRTYEPNSNFEYQRDCEIVSCRCGCDGRESCVSRSVDNCRTDNCFPCVVNGRQREPNTEFDLQDGCERYRCHCQCNGIHKCSSPVNTCSGTPRECRNCVVNGVTYPTNAPFMYERGCWSMKCRCDCDGYHNCDRRSATYTCDIAQPTSPPTTCRPCISDGRTYSPNTKFTRQKGCLNYKCQCFCDSRVQCVRTNLYACATGTVIDVTPNTNTSNSGSGTGTSSTGRGTESSGSGSRCNPCLVDNVERSPERKFFVYRGCKRYNCHCSCEGRYTCETRTPENICDANGNRLPDSAIGDAGESCTNCVVQGQQYPPNQRFTYEDGCEKFNCSCECDGTPSCPGDLVEDICRIDNTGNCRDCVVEGLGSYPPNQRFQYEKDCYRFDCRCNCDGSWRCPNSLTSYICDAPPGQCRPCGANGRSYRPNARFQYDEDCNRYDCHCFCNGTFHCPSERTRNICGDRGDTGDGDGGPINGCYPCDVIGRMYRPNRKFKYDENCNRYDCYCHCNGSWFCPPEKTRNICEGGSERRYPGQCRECTVENRRYPPNSRFAYESGCNRFDCDCRCNGSWVCPQERTRDICGGRDGRCRDCVVNDRSYQSESRFMYDEDCYRYDCDCSCNGSWVCPADRTRYICHDGDGDGGSGRGSGQCRNCVIGGRSYRSNSRFQYDEDCYRYDCDCRCNGSWVCPSERTKDICGGRGDGSGQCRNCVVNGRTYRSNSRFQFDEDCNRFDCDCKCNGAWVCPPERTRDICGGRGGGSGQCRNCVVNGRTYRSNSRFQFDEDCNRFDCDCRCNGSWVCPPERTKDICGGGGGGSGQCRNCVVHGRTYRSNSRFQFDEDCNRFDCDCRCNGSWVCPPARTRDICGGRGGGSGQCRNCVVNGRTYRSNSRFQFDEDCNRFDCDCRCNGSWVCPPERTKDICGGRGGGSGQCRNCVVHGRTYRSNSRFQFDEDCNRFDCDCGCNGSWVCPPERTRDICGGRPDRPDRPSRCRECVVDGRKYAPNSRFRYDKDCYRFNCDCSCNGSYNCPAERTQRICRSDDSRQLDENSDQTHHRRRTDKKCKWCIVHGKPFRPQKSFQYNKGCDRFKCECACNGSWHCPADKTENVCSRQERRCVDCQVQDQQYKSNSRFKYTVGCDEFECDCLCDGTYNCPAKRTKNICGGRSRRCNKDCKVRGASYPGDSVFVLREQCLQIQCNCYCDGTWDCDKSKTVDVCKENSLNEKL